MPLIFEDQTRVLRGCIFDVHNEVGIGYPEEAYHRAFAACCERRGIPLKSKQKGRLEHRNQLVHIFEYDLLADDEILLELKALPGGFARENSVQLLSYLKFWKKRLGLLVNFGREKTEIERLPFTEKALASAEDYEHIRSILNPADQSLLRSVRDGVLFAAKQHGLGYGDTVCAKLLCAEWLYRELTVQRELICPARFEDDDLGRFPINAILVGKRLLCCVVAFKDEIGPFEIGKTQSYLRALSLPAGIVVNFGKHALQIRGICPPNK
jgi:GxxExxY protein